MSSAGEQARRILNVDALARLHVSRDCTTRASWDPEGQRPVQITVTRPLGTGVEIVARGDYDEVIQQLTTGRRPHP